MSRHGVSNCVDCDSVGVKFFRGLLPRWGTVNLVHRFSDLVNLTAATADGFRTLSVEVQILHSVALQNRLVLDQLLANTGGCLSYSR